MKMQISVMRRKVLRYPPGYNSRACIYLAFRYSLLIPCFLTHSFGSLLIIKHIYAVVSAAQYPLAFIVIPSSVLILVLFCNNIDIDLSESCGGI